MLDQRQFTAIFPQSLVVDKSHGLQMALAGDPDDTGRKARFFMASAPFGLDKLVSFMCYQQQHFGQPMALSWRRLTGTQLQNLRGWYAENTLDQSATPPTTRATWKLAALGGQHSTRFFHGMIDEVTYTAAADGGRNPIHLCRSSLANANHAMLRNSLEPVSTSAFQSVSNQSYTISATTISLLQTDILHNFTGDGSLLQLVTGHQRPQRLLPPAPAVRKLCHNKITGRQNKTTKQQK